MSFVAAAIIGGVGSLGAAGLGFLGSSNAQKTAQKMQQQALDFEQNMFGQAKGALDPFINAGSGVLSTLTGLLTPGAGGGSVSDLLSRVPGASYLMNLGGMGVTNALSSRGLGASAGAVGTGLSQFNTNYGLNSVFAPIVNALQGVATMGGNAAGTLASAATGAGNSLGSTVSNFASPILGAIQGGYNALGGGLTGGANSITNMMLMSKLFPSGGGIYGGTGGGGGPGD